MAAKKWAIAGFIGVVALIVGNLFALNLPSRYVRYFYWTEKVLLAQLASLVGVWTVWTSTVSALQRTRPQLRAVVKVLLALYLCVSHCALLPVLLWRVGSAPHWFGFVVFGVYFQLVAYVALLRCFFLGVAGVARCGLIKLHRRKTFSQQDGAPASAPNFLPSRLGRVALLGVWILVAYCGFQGVMNASEPPRVTEVNITVPRLPRALSGIRVLHVADVHLGQSVASETVAAVVSIAQKVQPDVLVLVGDLVDDTVERLRSVVAPLAQLSAPRGVYFVTGNHEYQVPEAADVERWLRHLSELGFIVLRNSAVRIAGDAAAALCLAGVDDWDATKLMPDAGHGTDVDAAVSSCADSDAIVLLAHQPRAAKFALDSEHNIQLVLAGHTHGGQFFPASLLIYLVNPFYAGLYSYRGAQVYVSSGAVYWGIPMRLQCQAEVDLITLWAEENV